MTLPFRSRTECLIPTDNEPVLNLSHSNMINLKKNLALLAVFKTI